MTPPSAQLTTAHGLQVPYKQTSHRESKGNIRGVTMEGFAVALKEPHCQDCSKAGAAGVDVCDACWHKVTSEMPRGKESLSYQRMQFSNVVRRRKPKAAENSNSDTGEVTLTSHS